LKFLPRAIGIEFQKPHFAFSETPTYLPISFIFASAFLIHPMGTSKAIASLCLFATLFFSSFSLFGQSFDPTLFNAMKWRMIGPHRGGRTVGASGNATQPNVFYIGVNNGGVWKTTDAGRTWKPVFDDQPTGSIGDVAVSPSEPNTLYAASGEGIQRPDLSEGNGIYKSTDAGKTWTHLGLNNGLQIGGIAIDPKNSNRVFAAVLGHPYGPNTERGVFRTTDGGKTWDKVLYSDENTGAIQVAFDPVNSEIVYADMFATRQAPWENGSWTGPGSGLFKSTDGGKTWNKLSKGLPGIAEGLDRIGFCIAPSDSKRLYAVVSAKKKGGIYRSDDGGESWELMNADLRLWDRGDDFAEIKADPKNEDLVYDANVVVWKSADGGKTWAGFRGAPGGDDYHRLWINPEQPHIILLAGDQGAIITVNGGETWSSWYNQPTAQFYHVSADNAFPYNVYSGQQESGSVGISSRGNDGGITFRDWHPVGAEEYGYVVADPLDPDIIYGGKISRYDKRSGQTQNIAPESVHSGKYRFIRTAPIVFSPVDHKTLFYAGNVVFKTRNGGANWEVISPDLTRTDYSTLPLCIGVYKNDSMKTMPRRGVIYTLAPSSVDSNTIWAGTDDGLIHVTRDGGKNWKNVTPPALTTWSKVSMLEASHNDVKTAYAAVNCIRLDDQKPHLYKTSDGGKTWKEIVQGLPDDPINTVKEDPLRKGLLFCGSERMVHVSFDEGEHWQSLRLNMPCSSIRDLVIKDNDLVVATHGRSFWILDDISALRQLAKESTAKPVILYAPANAYRVRWSMNTDTPLPQEEPMGENPPDGAVIDYYLKEKASGEISLDILDSSGRKVRRYSSADKADSIPEVNIPLYWIRPFKALSGAAGSHRFEWDMHEQPIPVPASFPMSAIYEETAPAPTSPWVLPGMYTAQLTVNGKTYSHTFRVIMDPRVRINSKDLQKQYDLSMICYRDLLAAKTLEKELVVLKQKLSGQVFSKDAERKNKAAAFSKKLNEFTSVIPSPDFPNILKLKNSLEGLMNTLQEADAVPTFTCSDAVKLTDSEFEKCMLLFEAMKKDIEASF
jgi:photosystem II stability/assembly factor-like uncharacterized protein